MVHTYELQATHDSRKSFYGKAQVIELDNGTTQLKSYNTIVAEIKREDDTKRLLIYGRYSNTTMRHIREFMIQRGYSEFTGLENIRSIIEGNGIIKGTL